MLLRLLCKRSGRGEYGLFCRLGLAAIEVDKDNKFLCAMREVLLIIYCDILVATVFRLPLCRANQPGVGRLRCALAIPLGRYALLGVPPVLCIRGSGRLLEVYALRARRFSRGCAYMSGI